MIKTEAGMTIETRFCQIMFGFCSVLRTGQTPKYLAESIPASAGVMMGVLHQRIQNRIKASGEILKDFFILDQKCDIIEVGHIGLSTFITLHTHYLYSHTKQNGGTKINISPN